MTDKQIIIDGVDVSGCVFYGFSNLNNHLCTSKEFSKIDCTYCNDNPNCYYKQLKVKEQECEELKDNLPNAITRLMGELDQLKAELEQEKAWHKTSDEISKVNSEYTAKLQAENKELKEELEELKEENEYNEANAIEFKQTLTEIKEIAEKHAPRCNDNADCGFECDACHLSDLKQILNKISEVEE